MLPDLKTITDNFELLEDWEDRYRYVIELGKDLPPLADAEKTEDNRVRGCASQVWVVTEIDRSGAEPRLTFRGPHRERDFEYRRTRYFCFPRFEGPFDTATLKRRALYGGADQTGCGICLGCRV